MEAKKKNNLGLKIAFIIVLMVAVGGLFGTYYFYNKNLEIENKSNNTIKDNKKDDVKQDTNNDKIESLSFTELTKYTLDNNDEKEITKNEKKVTITRKNDNLFLINNSTGIYSLANYFYSTDYFLIFISGAGQFGEIYTLYDYDGFLLDKKDFNSIHQISNLRIENNKLIGDFVDEDLSRDGGFIIDNTYIFGCDYFPEIWNVPKDKDISKYTDLIKKHENDILSGTYEIKFINNKVVYEIVSSKQTIGTFVSENKDNLCVSITN